MRRQRVAVALPSLFNPTLVFLILSLGYASAYAQEAPLSSVNANGYVARILNDSPQEVADALERAEKLYLEGQLPQGANPISIILHGPEVEIFFKDNYDDYKKIVDLAARLSAFGVVIKRKPIFQVIMTILIEKTKIR